ncbi:hypothetical protein AB0D27_43760 [Streptomyces sp. NPDC048415]|uniref:hypothetical protein n=1 Tax=Streptomyces sp. NPDC048415 TaxID=3154822 RepID=UPI0034134FD8
MTDHPSGARLAQGRDRGMAHAARHRSSRPAAPPIEVSVNELTGTVSWRTRQPGGADRRGARARAASAAGPRGAAPIPTHPAAVRAAVGVPVEGLTGDQLRHHLAQVGALSSRVAADAAVGGRVPTAVAARLRSGSTPAVMHALTTERASTARQLTRRAPATGTGMGTGAAVSAVPRGPRR